MKNGLKFLGHPLHPPLTDFPIVLWSISLLWDILAFARGDPFWAQFSFWSIATGLVAALPTLATGLLDYASIPDDQQAAERTATRHMIVMLCTTALFVGSLLLRYGQDSLGSLRTIVAVILSAVGVALLPVGGWLGGELVFRHGVGRERDERKREL